MNQFINNVMNITMTENQDVAFKSSGNPLVDLFFIIGNINIDLLNLLDRFDKAFAVDPERTIRIVGWSRSIRKGAGRRLNLRRIYENRPYLGKLLPTFFEEEGYVKDLLYLSPSQFIESFQISLLRDTSYKYYYYKYCPRKGPVFNRIRKALGMTPKELRKLLVSAATTEQLMSSNRWDEIVYSQVPSLCMNNNRKHFLRHDTERFSEYIDNLSEGIGKINAGVSTPLDFLNNRISTPMFWHSHTTYLKLEDEKGLNEQWNAMVEQTIPKISGNIIPVVDTSASMVTHTADEPIAIGIGLGLVCAQAIRGDFHNQMITFSERPSFVSFNDTDTLAEKIGKIPSIVQNTNLRSVFQLILNRAILHKVPPADMPDTILIISDMQFDQGTRDYSTHEDIREMYASSGYRMPWVIYWNVGGYNTLPVTNDNGVLLYSGPSARNLDMIIQSASMIDMVETLTNKPDFDWVLL